MEIERAKVLEGILRTLFFVLVADIGGTLTISFKFSEIQFNYQSFFNWIRDFFKFGAYIFYNSYCFKNKKRCGVLKWKQF